MIYLDDTALKRLHETELEILVEIDRVCRKNGISYSLTGGTLLGAVRHGGFIPWDDDADISMLRSEYTRFQKACQTDLDKTRFYFQDIENTEGYRWGYGKVRRKNSVFLRENQENMPYEQGIFVDVFPRDGIPNGFFSRNLHGLACFCLRKLMWSAIGRATARLSIQRWCYELLYTLFPQNRILLLYKNLIQWSDCSPTKLVRALTFPLPKGVKGYDREWYQQYTEIQFQGHSFQVEAGYHEWLPREFGDYMKLPPVEKRKKHPVSRIEFPPENEE